MGRLKEALSKFDRNNPPTGMTKHNIWTLWSEHPLAERGTFEYKDGKWICHSERTNLHLRDFGPRQFDIPYICTIGAENGGWVRYQTLPACLHGHRVDLVYHFVCVNDSEPLLKIWSGNFHCINCGLMGSEQTLKDYLCNPVKTEVCDDTQTKSTYCTDDKTATKRSS